MLSENQDSGLHSANHSNRISNLSSVENLRQLLGLECKVCNNSGLVVQNIDGYSYAKDCDCMVEYRNRLRIKKSGLEKTFEIYTFEQYTTKHRWQENVKNKALEFVANIQGEWFYLSGAVGSGKSHICTAICAELIKRASVYYMPWRDDIVSLKGKVTDADAYQELIRKLKTVEVLYIDDFFKGKVTDADRNIAFEILNSRYNKRLITIISSELGIEEVMETDEAIGSRIYQMAKRFTLLIQGKEYENNYRLK